jgi:hypothetical protein
MSLPVPLIPVPVHGHTLFVTNSEAPLVPIRPICLALGIDFRSQQAKLRSHPTFEATVVEITTVGADGKLRDMLCMPADLVMLWLGGIHPDKVAKKVRAALIVFPREAARLLWAAWTAVRNGLPLHMGGRPMPGLFEEAQPMAWLQHATVQEAVLMNREAERCREAAARDAGGLRKLALRRVKQAGLTARDLDLLTRLAFFPPAPAQAELPLLEG